MKTVGVLVPIVAGVGLVFVWSAIHGAQVSTTLKDLLAGHAPATPPADPLILGRELSHGGTVAAEGLDPLRAAHASLNGGGP